MKNFKSYMSISNFEKIGRPAVAVKLVTQFHEKYRPAAN